MIPVQQRFMIKRSLMELRDSAQTIPYLYLSLESEKTYFVTCTHGMALFTLQ